MTGIIGGVPGREPHDDEQADWTAGDFHNPQAAATEQNSDGGLSETQVRQQHLIDDLATRLTDWAHAHEDGHGQTTALAAALREARAPADRRQALAAVHEWAETGGAATVELRDLAGTGLRLF